MADYTGLDKRLAYLFANGGGGGGECKVISGYYHNGDFYEDQSYTQIITGSEDSLYIDLDTTTLYLFDGTDYVEVQGGGGGAVSDGTVGVRIAVNIPASGSVTYSFDDLGITEYGSYWLLVNSKHAESNDGWKWIGFVQYSGYYTTSYVTSYAYALNSYYVSVSLNESAKTITFRNNNSNWSVDHLIEVLPLHPKIEIPKHTYSTTEQVVGTWIDGKPIYEITISAPHGTFSAVNDWQAFTGVSDAETMIDMTIIVNNQAGTESRAIYPRSDYSDFVPRFSIVNGSICWYTNSSSFYFNTFDWFITFRYTKTTD